MKAGGKAKQWGHHGKKYKFTAGNKQSEKQAEHKANLQAQAAYAHGYKGK